MRFFYTLIFIIFISSCSFDDKSGIWKNDNDIINIKKDSDQFKGFKEISSSYEYFDKEVIFDKKKLIKIPKLVNPTEWKENFYNQNNNFENFKYGFFNKILLKSKKISKYNINDYLLFINDKLILNDEGGNIIIFSIENNQVITKFNFYKKNYKKFKKDLNLIVENEMIYISDNIGYIYAYNFNKNELVWAKNFKVPFSANLKISENKLFTADINNKFIILNKETGNIIKQIPTEESLVKKNFKNNLSQNNESILYLNTFGSLYAIDQKTLNIKWFLNLNPSLEANNTNTFDANQIINDNDRIIINTNKFTYVIDSKSGSIIFRTNFTSLIKPLIVKDYLYLVSKNDLLISFNLEDGKIIFSHNIKKKITDFLNTKGEQIQLKFLVMANSNLLIFLKNSYVLNFSLEGDLKAVNKLPVKIKTNPIFIDTTMLLADTKKKLFVIN